MFNMASVRFILSCLLVSSLKLEAQSESFVTVDCQKQNVIAQYGTSTLLECVIQPHKEDTMIEYITWTKNNAAVLTYGDGKFHSDDPNFQLAKSSTWTSSNMNVSLLIANTILSHTGEYLCQVVTDRGDGKSSIHLTVKSNYSKPTIDLDREKITPDKDFTLTCKAQGGFPLGDIRWVVDDVAWKMNPKVEVHKNSNGLFDLTSKLSFGPNTLFRKFVCEVYNAAGEKEGQATFDYIPMGENTGEETKEHSLPQIVAPVLVIGSLIVGLLVALLLCRRRQRNNPQDIPHPEENNLMV